MKKYKLPLFVLIPVLLCASCGGGAADSSVTVESIEEATTSEQQKEEISYKGMAGDTISIEVSDSNVSVFFQKAGIAEALVEGGTIKITLLKEGETKLEIRYSAGNSEYGNLTVYDFSFNGYESTPIGTSIKLAKNKAEAKFSVSDESVATIDQEGNLTGIKEGIVTASLTYDEVTFEKDIFITQKENLIQKFYRNSTYLKFHGRNEFNIGSVSMDDEAAGFETTFYGTNLTCEMEGWYASYYGPTMFSVIIDGSDDYNSNCFKFTSASSSEYTLAKGLEEGFHTVKVLKRTEAGATFATMTSLATDGYFVKAETKDKLKLEAYGDSITAGYGNMRSSTQADGTNSDIQNTLMTYECVASRLLDADINVMARSGIGLGVAANIVGDYNMNTRYEYMTPLSDTKWNMHNYVPDVVIINLGTNDSWSGKFDRKTFVSAYTTLVKNLISYYGDDVSFVLCCGLMETGVFPIIQNYVYPTLLKEGISNIATLEFEKSTSNGHPLKDEHQKAGEQLAETIKELIA